MSVCIINYNSGNFGSVCNVLDFLGADSKIENNPDRAGAYTHYILPGVGSFNACMTNLENSGWAEYIRTEIPKSKKPFLGICLGMQLLATMGCEDGEKSGLNLIEGEICKLEPINGERIPHVGWNDVNLIRQCPLTTDIRDSSDFYFVHSYFFNTVKRENICGLTTHCHEFASIVSNENIFGVQFHPEKSSKSGIQLFKNFLKIQYA